MKKITLKIKFNKKNFKKILSRIFYCKRLFFIMFFGVLLIFTFDIVYKNAFLNVEYIDYTEDDNFIITDGKINNVNLNRVLKNIDKDKEKIRTKINKEYKDPFGFGGSEILGELDSETEYNNKNEDKDVDDDKNNANNGIMPAEL